MPKLSWQCRQPTSPTRCSVIFSFKPSLCEQLLRFSVTGGRGGKERNILGWCISWRGNKAAGFPVKPIERHLSGEGGRARLQPESRICRVYRKPLVRVASPG